MNRISATLLRNKVWRRLSRCLARENVVRLARIFKNAFTKVFYFDCIKAAEVDRYPDVSGEELLQYYCLKFEVYATPPTVSGSGDEAQNRKRLTSEELLTELAIMKVRFYEETGKRLGEGNIGGEKKDSPSGDKGGVEDGKRIED